MNSSGGLGILLSKSQISISEGRSATELPVAEIPDVAAPATEAKPAKPAKPPKQGKRRGQPTDAETEAGPAGTRPRTIPERLWDVIHG